MPFVVSVILFGLPHGAVDHLIPFRLCGFKFTPQRLSIVIGIYLLLFGLYLALWYVVPSIGFLLFIFMTWLHWGQGDLYALLRFAKATHLRSRRLRAATLLVRGSLPMLIPLLAFPQTYRMVAGDIIGSFQPGAEAQLDWAFSSGFRVAVGGGLMLLIVTTLIQGWRASKVVGRRSWLLDAGETGLLLLYFAVVPSLLAGGLYFCLWHATRHLARLYLIDRTSATIPLKSGSIRRWRIARDAAPLTLVALLLLAGLYRLVPYTPQTLGQHVGLYMALIAALTFPHTLVVCWMDWREGLW